MEARDAKDSERENARKKPSKALKPGLDKKGTHMYGCGARKSELQLGGMNENKAHRQA